MVTDIMVLDLFVIQYKFTMASIIELNNNVPVKELAL